jgi:hypothetical protein
MMQLFSKKERNSAQRAIELVRGSIAQPSNTGIAPVAAAVEVIVKGELWRTVSRPDGSAFESFGAFAVAASGLGVCTVDGARLLRHALLSKDLPAPWVEVVELIGRRPGRVQTLVKNEDFARFYPIPTAVTELDRLLPLLRDKHPGLFQRVCAGEITAYAAAKEAKLIAERTLRLGQILLLDSDSVKAMPESAQCALLHNIFHAVCAGARDALIAEIKPDVEAWMARGSPPPACGER